ncbi:MAG TPA: hypothetical protein VNZ55_11910 [Thermomicrobiales bacterium]|nr:hypothetical protein [Thermomicrobiales bacterium]
MANQSNEYVARDPQTGLSLDMDEAELGAELEKRVESGEITREHADELLQTAARREIAENGPDRLPDEGGTVTEGGFGSGQGMASESTWHGHPSSGGNHNQSGERNE